MVGPEKDRGAEFLLGYRDILLLPRHLLQLALKLRNGYWIPWLDEQGHRDTRTRDRDRQLLH